ncbi:MAG: ATP-binding protein, partial [Clostridia bacterium]|nr:ATP-binding protein [Clostridia bacterium]
MKQSIFQKTFVIILITITMVLFLSWIVINYLADDIYKNQKLNQIQHASKDIQRILAESVEDEEVILKLKRLSFTTGTNINIFDAYDEPIYIDYLIHRKNERIIIEAGKKLRSAIPRLAFNINKGEHVEVEYMNPLDKNTRLFYAERYDNGILAVIQIPVEAIDETVNIFKDIIKYMILAALIFGAIGAYVLSKNITKPLVELNNVALEMGKLNFSCQYKEQREDEIGQLGKTLNRMAAALEKTIIQLKDELKKEKTLDVLRKQFVAQVSHEIQTPLAIIQGYIEALEDGIVESEEEVKYHYEVINDEITKMVKILRDLLDLSQLEAGTFKINKENFDMMTLLRRVSEKYAEISKKQDIEFIFSHAKQRCMIYGDVFRLEQVLSNFIKNAFEHTSPKGKINISSEKIDNHIRVNIQNTGAPIPNDDLPYIWESFYKSKNKLQSKGTGLGLAI